MKKIIKCSDRYKCQCLIIPSLSRWLVEHHSFLKFLELTAVGMNLLSLIYFPVYGHFLLKSYQNIEPYEQLLKNCHYFQDLRSVKYIGFDLITCFRIRVVVMIVLFFTDLLGSIFSYIHPPCGTKMYFMDTLMSLVFFVLFPAQFCLNLSNNCIGNSPILHLYRLQFMIEFNIGWLGVGALSLIAIGYPIIYFSQKYFNLLGLNSLFYDIIYFLIFIPFLTLALINFITSLWTSSAFINILTIGSAFLGYILYNASILKNPRFQITSKQNYDLKGTNSQKYQFHSNFNHMFPDENVILGNEKVQKDNFPIKNVVALKHPIRKNSSKIQFQRQWHNNKYHEFYS